MFRLPFGDKWQASGATNGNQKHCFLFLIHVRRLLIMFLIAAYPVWGYTTFSKENISRISRKKERFILYGSNLSGDTYWMWSRWWWWDSSWTTRSWRSGRERGRGFCRCRLKNKHWKQCEAKGCAINPVSSTYLVFMINLLLDFAR